MHTTVKADPSRPMGKSYIWNLGEAVSQTLAALFGLNANLTFSAYCGYWEKEGTPVLRHFHKPINMMFSDPLHCQNAWGNLT